MVAPDELFDGPRAGVAPDRETRPAGDVAVALDGLRVEDGEDAVLADVDLRVPRGSACGIVDPEGEGKTALVRALVGCLLPDAGSVSVLGEDPWSTPGLLAEVNAVYGNGTALPTWTVRENLLAVCSLRGCPRADAASALDAVGLDPSVIGSVPYGECSPGVRRRVEVAIGLVGDPSVLVLNDPLREVGPPGRRAVRRALVGRRDQGAAVVVTTTDPGAVTQFCDRVGRLQGGHLEMPPPS